MLGGSLFLFLFRALLLHVDIIFWLLLGIDIGDEALVRIVEKVKPPFLEYSMEVALQAVIQRLLSGIRKRIST